VGRTKAAKTQAKPVEPSEAMIFEPGCKYCGTSVCPELADGRHWDRGVCALCRHKILIFGSAGRYREQVAAMFANRVLQARQELRGDPPRKGQYSRPMRWIPAMALERINFRWFHETTGAEPSPDRRWNYVDNEKLVAALYPPTPAPTLSSGPPCPACGCDRKWLTQKAPANSGRTGEETRCGGCGWMLTRTQTTVASGHEMSNTATRDSVPRVERESIVAARAATISGVRHYGLGSRIARQLGLTVFQDANKDRVRPGEPWNWWFPELIRATAWVITDGRVDKFRSPELADQAREAYDTMTGAA
jgi:hypothetical protein